MTRRRQAIDTTAGAKPPRAGAVAIGAFVPRIAGAVLQAHGFPSAAIVADWPGIVGAEFADFTLPERLVWPRGGADAHPQDEGAGRTGRHRRHGATLVLRVDGPRAIEVQHAAPQLIERVNTYFGYAAVAQLRIIQAPVRRRASARQPRPPAPERLAAGDPALDGIEDEGLRAALARLSARVAGHPRRG